MPLALTFATPLLLVGLLAAGIPWLLHLLASVRAQEVYFPTLRFLRVGMEKTARRRRIQHWLLLAVRTALLAMLCLAASELITPATGGWLGGPNAAAVLVLDNSFSMSAKDGSATRFDSAKAQAAALLGGDEKPAMAAVLTTAGGPAVEQLTGRMDAVRDALTRASIAYGPDALAERVEKAVDLLAADASSPRKAVYVFSDLQRTSLQRVTELRRLAETKDVHLFFVRAGAGTVGNVGIADLQIAGRRAVDSVLEFTARLVNSSPVEKVVDVELRVEDQSTGQRARVRLAASPREGSSAAVRFRHAFRRQGPASGEVVLEQADDLPADNIRRFCLDIGGRVGALVVRGPRPADDPWWLDSGGRILAALQPYAEGAAAWPIAPRIVEGEQFAPDDLGGIDIAFFSDVPALTAEQAAAVRKFVLAGGTAMFFLGPNVKADAYNEQFAAATDPLLPARLGEPVGEIGPTARALAVAWVDVEHPYFSRLWPGLADYLTPPVLVQRRFRLAEEPRGATVLASLAGGEPFLLLRNVGAGRSILCTTTSSPRWSNFTSQPLFLPLVVRACLLARQDPWRDRTYLAGSRVSLRLPETPGTEESAEATDVRIVLPDKDAEGREQAVTVAARRTPEGLLASFDGADRPGFYAWSAAGGEPSGQFAVNSSGAEADLAAMTPEELKRALDAHGIKRAYVGSTVAEAQSLAAAEAQGRNWWDVLTAVGIVLLVTESIVANRRRMQRDEVPAHLNPRVAA